MVVVINYLSIPITFEGQIYLFQNLLCGTGGVLGIFSTQHLETSAITIQLKYIALTNLDV